MLPLNHKRTTSSLAPPIFYVVKNLQLKDRRLPIARQKEREGERVGKRDSKKIEMEKEKGREK